MDDPECKKRKLEEPPSILIGSRKSVLALWQTKHVQKLLQVLIVLLRSRMIRQLQEQNPKTKFEIFEKDTHGDLVLDKPLVEIGSTNPGLFTKDLEVYFPLITTGEH
jgi:porphobilinogen deaminase